MDEITPADKVQSLSFHHRGIEPISHRQSLNKQSDISRAPSRFRKTDMSDLINFVDEKDYKQSDRCIAPASTPGYAHRLDLNKDGKEA